MRVDTNTPYEFLVNKAALPDYNEFSKVSQLTTVTTIAKHGSHYLQYQSATLSVKHCKDAISLDYAI